MRDTDGESSRLSGWSLRLVALGAGLVVAIAAFVVSVELAVVTGVLVYRPQRVSS